YINAKPQYAEQQKQWFSDISDAFEEATGAKVNFETYTSADEELTKIQTSVVSGQGPDIFGVGTTFTPTAYSTDAFVALSAEDWARVGGEDKFVPAALGLAGPTKDDR